MKLPLSGRHIPYLDLRITVPERLINPLDIGLGHTLNQIINRCSPMYIRLPSRGVSTSNLPVLTYCIADRINRLTDWPTPQSVCFPVRLHRGTSTRRRAFHGRAFHR